MIKGTRDQGGFRPVGILLAVFAASAAGGFGPGGRAATVVAAPLATLPLKGRAIEAAVRQPLRFDALDSQDPGAAGFVSRGNGYALLLERGGAVVSLSGRPQSSSSLKTPGAAATVVRMTWPGANRRVRPAGLEAATGVSNYLIGNDPARWRLGVPSFSRVLYRDLYPGIDLAFYGNQERLEYDFVVASGGDPRAIRLRFSGEDAIRIDARGDLVVRSGAAEIVQQAPVVYQEHEGTRQRVAGRYVKTNRHEVGFVVAPYDRTRTLYIDPVLAFSTFLGGSGSDAATAVAVDSAGYAYVTGTSRSFSLTSEDVFVTKISPTGALVYATYVGDDNTNDRGRGIALDSAGNAYVTGDTSYPGSGTSFPIVGGFVPTASPTVSGGAILFKLNAAGNSLLYSTVLRSGSASVGYGVAVEGANAYVVGQTVAGQGFPIWPDPGPYSGFIGGPGGLNYAFIVKINTSNTGLTSLAYATRFGGSDRNFASAIAVNATGQAYVTGNTTSFDFPIAGSSPAQPVCGTGSNCNNRIEDAFVSKFAAAGTTLLYSTYAGGSGADFGNAIAIDGSGSAYVSGSTFSVNFPVTPGAFDNACSTGSGCSFSDGFVLKLSPTGSSFAYSTYLGGQSEDVATAIAVDSAGNAHVVGYSGSPDFPVTGDALQPARAGTNTDAFVSVLNSAGTGLVYSSYLGGTGNISGGDKAFGIALDSAGSAWIVGQTDSPDFPVTPGTIQPAHGGGLFDGFAVKIGSSALVTDADGDGLPTSWEILYGLDPNSDLGNNGANGDPDGDGFTNLQEFQRGSNPTRTQVYLHLLDLNSDRGGDVFLYNKATGARRFELTNRLTDGMTETLGAWDPGWQIYPANLNADGYTDFFLYDPVRGFWIQALNHSGDGTFTYTLGNWDSSWTVVPADLDGDRLTDMFVYNFNTGVWVKCFVDGGGGFKGYAVGNWDPGWTFHTADLNGDGRDDFFLYNRVNGVWVEAFSQAGFGTFDYPASGLWDPGWQVIRSDLNGDGRTDLFLLNAAGVHVSALSLAGGGFDYVGGPQWAPGWSVSAGDLNSDGRTDLFLYNAGSGIWAEAFSDGGGSFTYASGAWDPGWTVVVTEFNEDGRGDLILSRANGVWVQATNTGVGTFTYAAGNWGAGWTLFTNTPSDR